MAQRIRKTLGMLLPVLVICLQAAAVPALIMIKEGNEPVTNTGWPTGSEEVANLPSRLRMLEGPPFGGGEYYFEYQCKDTAEFNDALKKFGAIRAPRPTTQWFGSMGGANARIVDPKPLLLIVHDGPKSSGRAGAGGQRVDWTFTVWVAESFHHLFSNPKSTWDSDHPNYRRPVPPPTIDVYVGGDSPIAWKKVTVPDGVCVIDQRVEAAPVNVKKGGVVQGGLFDLATRQVIAGAEVVLVKRGAGMGKDTPRVTTEADGRFEIKDVPKGYYSVLARAKGYAGRNLGTFDNDSGHAYLDFDAFLAPPASLRGVVTDDKEKPLPGVTVTAESVLGMDGLGYQCADAPTTTTDEQGRFELAALPEGFACVRCQAPTLHQTTSIFNLYKVTARFREKPEEISIVMGGTGTVVGKVMDSDGKPPTRQFIAELEPKGGSKVGSWGGSTQCNADGSFEFKGVPAGEYVVAVKPNPGRAGEESEPQAVTMTAGKTVELKFVSSAAR